MFCKTARALAAVATVFGVAMWLAAPAAAGTPEEMDAWVASLEGGWTGEDNQTPLGRIPFAMLFEKQADGSYLNHSAANRETFIRMRFVEDEDGRWLLEESGGMEGVGVRGSTLVPAEPHGEIRRWISPEDPDYVVVEMAVSDQTLYIKVLVRGQEHAQLNLQRIPDEQLPAAREAFAESAARDPEEGSIHDYSNSEQVPRTVRQARQRIARRPDDAAARMELAAALIELIQSEQAMGPRYAGELLETLQAAVELDPQSSSAWQGLAGYYLNAPPIAGGSLDKAEDAARKLIEIDPPAGEALLAQVESRRSGGD